MKWSVGAAAQKTNAQQDRGKVIKKIKDQMRKKLLQFVNVADNRFCWYSSC